jgi:ribosomal protein S18 acetylase RimI-like enzyme
MPVTTRTAHPADAPSMCAILNEIITIGGTTAYEEPFETDRMIANYIAAPLLIACTVAEIDGEVCGFQALWRPDPGFPGASPMPPDWAVIASFVKVGMTGHGIGKALFSATQVAARAAGAKAIDATIRADNASGLRFYSGMGFVDFATIKGVPLKDGTPVDRIRKVFPLQAD